MRKIYTLCTVLLVFFNQIDGMAGRSLEDASTTNTKRARYEPSEPVATTTNGFDAHTPGHLCAWFSDETGEQYNVGPELSSLSAGTIGAFVTCAKQSPFLVDGVYDVNFRGSEDVNDVVLHNIVSVFKNIKKMNLSGCKQITARGFKEVFATQLPQLEMLDVSYTNIDDDVLYAIVMAHPNLKVLKLSGCGVTARGFYSIARLEHLECLVMCDTVVDEIGLKAIIKSNEKLVFLGIEACALIRPSAFRRIGAPIRSLHGLNVCSTQIDDCGLLAITQACENIEYINIRDCRELTPIGIGSALGDKNTCRNLRTLDVNITHINKEALDAIVLVHPKLEVFKVGDCEDDNNSITGDDVAAAVARLHELKRLSVKKTTISDAGLAAITRANQNLKYLDISGCACLTPQGIIAAIAHLGSLEKLNIKTERLISREIHEMTRNAIRASRPDVVIIE